MAEYTSSYTGAQIDSAVQKSGSTVLYTANQGLTDAQKTAARDNIGAGTSSLTAPSGSPSSVGWAAFRGVTDTISSGGTDLITSDTAYEVLLDIEALLQSI